jgi:hypothetical protein
MMTNAQLYETDYGEWLAHQVRSLRQGKWDELDIPRLIEELEGLNKSNQRELRSYLAVLLTHLLKWEFQPQSRCGSWTGSIKNSRKGLLAVLKDQRSLKNYLPEILLEAYEDAKEWVSDETGIKVHLFPAECPYAIEQLKNRDWLPK